MELLVTIIILALIFDYINGFHDAANSIATIVSTKVLTPFQAVLWAAFFNFVAFFIAKYIIGGFGHTAQETEGANWDFAAKLPERELDMNKYTVKNSQIGRASCRERVFPVV